MKKLIFSILFTFNILANIIPDGNSNVYVEKSQNGIDIVNISSPNNFGISLSTFSEFNIPENGVILNNRSNISRSQIAGIINGNNNIKENRAKLAILEVNGVNESKLSGILEAVSKDKLDVILSNSNGITLDGINFINIHNMSLVAAKLNIEDEKISYNVPSANIVSLKELNVRDNLDKLELIAKEFKANSDIYAKDLLIKTNLGEDKVAISASIIGSVHGDVVKIIAPKSSIKVDSISAKDLSLISDIQADIKNIASNNVDIEIDKDFENRNNIVSNNNLSIKAKNILNDGNILISDNIFLQAKENIYNLNGGIIHADNKLNIISKNIDNIGKVLSYGENKVKWKSANEEIFDENNITLWKKNISDKSGAFNWLAFSDVEYAKEKALKQFYITKDNISEVKIVKDKIKKKIIDENTQEEIEVEEEVERIIYPEITEGKEDIKIKGDKYSYLFTNYFSEYLSNHKRDMDISNDYVGSYTLSEKDGKYTLKSYVESSKKDTKFSIISGKIVNIENENILNNKDGHILTDIESKINTKILNNSSSISDNYVILKDGYERLNYSGDKTCWGLGLAFCTIDHNVNYIRDLSDGEKVYLKALVSNISGNVDINAEEVNFKAYNLEEAKKILREEDQIYVNNKEDIKIKEKKQELKIENDERYTNLSNFYKSKSFLNNLKINTNRLNIVGENLKFENLNIVSNKTFIQGSNIKVEKDLKIDSEKLDILSKLEKDEKVVKYEERRAFFRSSYLDKKEIIEKSLASNINADKIFINSKKNKISASNIIANHLISDNLNIEANVVKNEIKLKKNTFLKENLAKLDSEKAYSSNILISENANIKKLNIKSSNISLNNANIDDINVETTSLNTNLYENEKSIYLSDILKLNFSNKEDKEKYVTHQNSNVILGSNSKINKKASFVNTNLIYDNLEINAKNVNFNAIKDIEEKTNNNFNASLGIDIDISSPILNNISDISKGITEKNTLTGIAKVTNGVVGGIYNLSSNLKVGNRNANISDLKNSKIQSDFSNYLNISKGFEAKISNQNIFSYKEKVRNNILSGNKLIFNNNEEINYTSTVFKDTNIVYNKVKNINKNILKENNKENITSISASVNIGLGTGFDGEIFNNEIKEKLNSRNIAINTKEEYIDVENVKAKGLISENSSVSGNISNLYLEDVKDEIKEEKIAIGASINIGLNNFNLFGNYLNKKEDKILKNEFDVSNIKIDNLKIKEEKKEEHDIDFGLNLGSSGFGFRIKDKEISLGWNIFDVIFNQEKFKEKLLLAKEEIRSNVEALKDKIDLLNVKEDENLDISEKENRTFLELKEAHIYSKYSDILNLLNESDARTKEEREELVKLLGFNNYYSLEENEDIPEGLKKRLEEKKVKIAIDQYNNVYTLGEISELAFKKGLARERGIHDRGRIAGDKLLGASIGNIYSKYIEKGNNEKLKISTNNENIPKDMIVISDLTLEIFFEHTNPILDNNTTRRLTTELNFKKAQSDIRINKLLNRGKPVEYKEKALVKEARMNLEEYKYIKNILSSKYKNPKLKYLDISNIKINGDVVSLKYKSTNKYIAVDSLLNIINEGQAYKFKNGFGASIEDAKLINDLKEQIGKEAIVDISEGTIRLKSGISIALSGVPLIATGLTTGGVGVGVGAQLVGIGASNFLLGLNEVTSGVKSLYKIFKNKTFDYKDLGYIESQKNENLEYIPDQNYLRKILGDEIYTGLNIITLAPLPEASMYSSNLNTYRKISGVTTNETDVDEEKSQIKQTSNLQKENKSLENSIAKYERDKKFLAINYSENLIKYDDVPDAVYERVKKLYKNKLVPDKNMSGNGVFRNEDKILPPKYEYREFDIYPKNTIAKGRGKPRLVFGNDGSIYYTEDHYKTFKKIR